MTCQKGNFGDFVVEGYYCFQEYAALHMIDHLEMLNQSQDRAEILRAKEPALAVMQFSERHKQQRGREESPGILTGYLSNDRLIDCLSPLLTETRQLRAEDESIAGLGALGEVVSRVRSNIEQLIDTAAPDQESTQDIKRYYGSNWYKCSNNPVSTSTKGFLAQNSVIATSTGTNDHIAVLSLDVLDSRLASFRRRNWRNTSTLLTPTLKHSPGSSPRSVKSNIETCKSSLAIIALKVLPGSLLCESICESI